MSTNYEANAIKIANELGIGLTVKKAEKQTCPPWRDNGKKDCDHVHGWLYEITLTVGGKTLTFPFWNSLRDKADGKTPTAYDILCCVASDAQCPTDPDEVVAEFGDMKPSQAIAVANRAKELQALFNPTELRALSEIQ
jgi:hypothetical protein